METHKVVVPTLTDNELDRLEHNARVAPDGVWLNINPALVLRVIFELRHLRAVDDEPTGDALTPSEGRGYGFGRRMGYAAGYAAAIADAVRVCRDRAETYYGHGVATATARSEANVCADAIAILAPVAQVRP